MGVSGIFSVNVISEEYLDGGAVSKAIVWLVEGKEPVVSLPLASAKLVNALPFRFSEKPATVPMISIRTPIEELRRAAEPFILNEFVANNDTAKREATAARRITKCWRRWNMRQAVHATIAFRTVFPSGLGSMESHVWDVETIKNIKDGDDERALLRCVESLESVKRSSGAVSAEYAQMQFILAMLYHRLAAKESDPKCKVALFEDCVACAEAALHVRDELGQSESSIAGILVEFLARVCRDAGFSQKAQKYAERNVSLSLFVAGKDSIKHLHAQRLYESII